MMPICAEEKNHETVIKDFFDVLSVFNRKMSPLIFSDDWVLTKIIRALNVSKMTTKELAHSIEWGNFRGVGWWLNILYRDGVCEWKSDKIRKIWKLTSTGRKFADIITKIHYPKSRFVLPIRLSADLTTSEMAIKLGFSGDHYERVEKTGYPWSYRKANRLLNMFPTEFELNEHIVLERLHRWIIDKRVHFLKTRGHYNRPEILETRPAFSSEKVIIKDLERLGLKKNKDFVVHKNVNGRNIDLVVKADVFIEIIKSRKNSEVTYSMVDSALKHLSNATKDVLKRVVIILPDNGGRIGCECLDLLKGRALVFFPALPILKQKFILLNHLIKKRTVSELHLGLGKHRETIRSGLKSLMADGLVKRIGRFGWVTSEKGLNLIKLCKIFLVKSGCFLKSDSKTLQNNIEFVEQLIELRKNSTVGAKLTDGFSLNILNCLKKDGIEISGKPIRTRFNLKFPDIIAIANGHKFVIECIRTKKSALYSQVLRLAYKIKILKGYSNEKATFIALVSCKDDPLQFDLPNRPFRLLRETCDKVFIDSNLNELANFIKQGV